MAIIAMTTSPAPANACSPIAIATAVVSPLVSANILSFYIIASTETPPPPPILGNRSVDWTYLTPSKSGERGRFPYVLYGSVMTIWLNSLAPSVKVSVWVFFPTLTRSS